MIAPKPLLFPRPKPRLLQRLPERKRMTIAAGFKFSKGLLLCADSQFTIPGTSKFEGTKVHLQEFVAEDGGRTVVVFAFSGTVDYAKMAIGDMVDALGEELAQNGGDTSVVPSILKRVLEEFHAKHIYAHPQFPSGFGPGVEFLIGVRPNGESKVRLFKSRETAFLELKDFGTVGNGSLLADYLIPLSYKHPKMSMRDVASIAAHILHQTKRYVDGCGGESEFIVLYDDGDVGGVDRLIIESAEIFSGSYDHVVRNIFLEACDWETTDERLRTSIGYLHTLLLAHRDDVKRKKAAQDAWDSERSARRKATQSTSHSSEDQQ